MTKQLVQTTEERYESADGFVMQREEGETPNGNKIFGRWVLRDPNGNWVDFDQYRHDLAERYGFFAFGTL
jgi:hypothetical protein